MDGGRKKRFGVDSHGPVIPFGAECFYLPIYDKDDKRIHKFGNKLLAGIFMGYVLHAGGGWSGDLYVLDQEEINQAQYRSDLIPLKGSKLRKSKSSEMETTSGFPCFIMS